MSTIIGLFAGFLGVAFVAAFLINGAPTLVYGIACALVFCMFMTREEEKW